MRTSLRPARLRAGRGLGIIVGAGLTVGLARSASAQIWNGGGADDNFTTAANWTPTVPPNNGTAFPLFDGTTRLSPKVNVNFDLIGINFNSAAGAFNIGQLNNSVLTVRGGGIIDASTNVETFSVPVNFATGSAI